DAGGADRDDEAAVSRPVAGGEGGPHLRQFLWCDVRHDIPIIENRPSFASRILRSKHKGARRRDMARGTGFRSIARALAVLALLAPLFASGPALADPADIDAAARGVVRVVIIAQDGDSVVPISHGTGFAITPERVVTNAHVVAEAREDQTLSIGIVPSDGEDAVYSRLISVSPRNDLALLATTSPMALPPLTLSGATIPDSG